MIWSGQASPRNMMQGLSINKKLNYFKGLKVLTRLTPDCVNICNKNEFIFLEFYSLQTTSADWCSQFDK